MTRVKLCGITNIDDARLAADRGAWAVGLILWPGSPRACPTDAAEEIGAALHRRTEVVGVFVNATLDEVALAADRFGLTMLQLHGDEGPAYCREAARRTGAKVMKAVRVRDAASVRDLGAFHTDFHMLDAHVPGHAGRHGRDLRLGAGEGPPGRRAAGALRRPRRRQRGRGASPGAPLRGGQRQRHRGGARRKDPAKVSALFEAVAAADRELATA